MLFCEKCSIIFYLPQPCLSTYFLFTITYFTQKMRPPLKNQLQNLLAKVCSKAEILFGMQRNLLFEYFAHLLIP